MGTTALHWLCWALVTPGVLGQCKLLPRYPFARPKAQSHESEFAVGTRWEYECLPGYKKQSFFATCLPTSQWSDTQKFCKRKSCENPRDLLHGSILMPKGFEFGATIMFSCDEGYRLIGDTSATCVLTGSGVSWDADVPMCDNILCEPPPSTPHGDVDNHGLDNLPFGAVLTYRCQAGPHGEKLFDLVGEPSIHCTSHDGHTGVWSSPPPLCVPATKCPLPHVEDGIMEAGFRHSYWLNDSVEFRCKPGFTMRGHTTVWCQAGGVWRPALPRCFQGCPPPPRVPHASHSLEGEELFSPGQQVSYHCEPGHALQGADTLGCTSSGTWSPEAPTCKAKSCEALPSQLPHGRVLAPPNLQLGAQASFVCDEGFRLRGQHSAECVPAGPQVRWSSGLPVCESLSCGPPPAMEHGRNTYSGSARPDTLVKYSCPSAFRIIGESMLFCRSPDGFTASWDKAAPMCQVFNRQAQCTEPHVPGGQKDPRARPPYRHGDSVTFSCQANFTLRGGRTVWCQANSTWGPVGLPVCDSDHPLDCPPLPAAAPHTHHTGQSGVRARPGQVVTFSCEPGFLLQGEKTLMCLSSGDWSSQPPACTEAQCDPPAPPPHGQVQRPPSLGPGSTVTFSCDEGYRLQGQPSSRCVIAGQKATWSRIPMCEEIFCPPPPPANLAMHSGDPTQPARLGSSITYRCPPGPEAGVNLVLEGEDSLHCTVDAQQRGVWSGPAPKCRLTVSGGPCPSPKLPRGHVVSGQRSQYGYNDTVGFACEDGFTLRGSASARCSGLGQWDPKIPSCEKACQVPPQIHNGQVEDGRQLRFDPGSSVQYSCNLGYKLEGAASLHCTVEGQWIPSTPKCTAAPCEPMLKQVFKKPQNGFIRMDTNSSCEEGYRLGSSVYQLCGGSKPWYLEVRLCEEITCAPPPSILHGWHSGSPSEQVPYGSTITYGCHPGPEPGVDFQLEGESKLHCTSPDGQHGTWSGPAPKCRLQVPATHCPEPHVPHGFLVSGREGPYFYNDSLVFHCTDGFLLHGSARLRCTAAGAWEPEPPACEKEASCQSVGDEVPEPPEGSHVIPVNTSCEVGYQLVGHKHRKCQDFGSGAWFQKILICKAVSCQPPPTIAHGSISKMPPRPAPYGSEVSYVCDAGFSLQGGRSLRCIQDTHGLGTWNSQPPSCVAIASKPPCPRPDIRHGHVLNQSHLIFMHNDSLEVACSPGFLLNGSHLLHCINGHWAPSLPSCVKMASSSGCQPLSIAHGNHTGGNIERFSPGMSLLYSCEPGHLLVGEPLLLCTHEGTWSQPAPHCREVNCSSPESVLGVQRGLEPGRLYQFGAIVTVECEDGYTLEGSSQSQCQDDRHWNPPLAICRSQGSLVPLISGLSAGFVLLVCLASTAWCMLLRHRGRHYYTNKSPQGGDLHLEMRQVYAVDPYNPSS